MTMITLKRVNKVIQGVEFVLLTDANNNYYFTEANLENNLELGERSIRNFLAGKSPQALRCKGFLSGKSAKIEGYNKSVKIVDLVVAENFIEYKALGGNKQALLLLTTYASIGLRTWVATAFGETVTKVEVDYWNKLRDAGKVERRKFTDAIKAYATRHPEYGQPNYGKLTAIMYNIIKVFPGRDEMTDEQLKLLTKVENKLSYLLDIKDHSPEIALKMLVANYLEYTW